MDEYLASATEVAQSKTVAAEWLCMLNIDIIFPDDPCEQT